MSGKALAAGPIDHRPPSPRDPQKQSPKPNAQSTRHGLTLLELLAALILASMLMASIVGVLRQMKQKAKQVEQLDVQPDWHHRFIRLITHDLRNARRINVDETSITLTGYMGRDFETGKATHRPTQVRYFVSQSDDNAWLLRKEDHIDIRSTENSKTEVVCHGIRSIGIERLEEGTLRLTKRLRQPTSQVFVTVPAKLLINLFDDPDPNTDADPIVQTEVFIR